MCRFAVESGDGLVCKSKVCELFITLKFVHAGDMYRDSVDEARVFPYRLWPRPIVSDCFPNTIRRTNRNSRRTIYYSVDDASAVVE
jgi:hypothetical protein